MSEIQETNVLKEGHFYLFTDVDYTGNIKVTRPLLVLKLINDSQSFIGLKCTSRERPYDPFSYKLMDWEQGGLLQESSVRCDKPLFLQRSSIKCRTGKDGNYELSELGEVSSRDLMEIAKMHNTYCRQLEELSEQILNNAGQTKVFLIKRIEKYVNGDVHEDMSVFPTESAAANEFSKANPHLENCMHNGKLMSKTVSFEKGYVLVDKNGNYNIKDITITHKKTNVGDVSKNTKRRA